MPLSQAWCFLNEKYDFLVFHIFHQCIFMAIMNKKRHRSSPWKDTFSLVLIIKCHSKVVTIITKLYKGHFPPGGIFLAEGHLLLFKDQLAESGPRKGGTQAFL